MEDVLRLLDELQVMAVEDPRTIIGPISYGLNKDEVQMQIAKVRAALPQELRNVSKNVRESEMILAKAAAEGEAIVEKHRDEAAKLIINARSESEKIIELGKSQQERMVSDSEIMKLSKAQAEEIRNSAEADAKRIRNGADQYAADVLGRLEANVERVSQAVRASRAELSSLESNPVSSVPLPSDRIRVR